MHGRGKIKSISTMKFNILYIFALLILFGCKKDRIIPEKVNIKVSNQIWNSQSSKKTINIDSIKYVVVDMSDTTSLITGYASSDGIIDLSLTSEKQYRITTTSRSYTKGHYTKTETFKSSTASKNGNEIQIDFTIYYYDMIGGNGSTKTKMPEITN